MTPGIRPRDSGYDDHKRTLTPYQAVAFGADYLVVGRPITRSSEPLQTTQAIISDMEAALYKLSGAIIE